MKKRIDIKRNVLLQVVIVLVIVVMCIIKKISDYGNTYKYLEDYNYVWKLLETAYPYYDYINSQAVALNEIKESYRNEVLEIENEEDFSNMLSRMFNELGGLGHLSVVDNYTYNSYCNVLNNGESFGNDKMDIAFSKRLDSKKINQLYHVENLDSLNEKKEFSSSIEIQYWEDIKTAYIKISSFSSDLIERDSTLMQDTVKKYPDIKNVIFDISGNSGGSDIYWIQNIVEPFGGDYTQKSIIYLKESSLSEEYIGNDNLREILQNGDEPNCINRYGLNQYIDNTLCICKGSQLQSKNSDIKRWVIISGKTYSSADSFAQFCKDTGWAILVGTNTGGAGGGMTPIVEILPNTGILIRFSIDVVVNDNGELNVIEGTQPNIRCIKNETALDKCIEQIENKERE